MEANIIIINRNQIPNNIYLCGGINDEWYMIHLCDFENGLQCILGAGSYQGAESIIESTKDEMDYVLENTNNPDELQNYYYENYQDFKLYKDCVKIFDYYTNNQHLIREAYNTYFEQDNIEEGYESN